MLRFAVPASLVAGALLCCPLPVRAADDVCAGVAVTIGGMQPLGLWPPTCVFLGPPTDCFPRSFAERPFVVIDLIVCVPNVSRS